MTNIEFEGAQLKESLIAEQESIGNSIGHEYAREGLFEHLKALKECYVLPDKLFSLRDERGLTILHIAVLKGNSEIVEWILSNDGIDLDIGDVMGNTPLLCAAIYNRTSIMKMLIDKGADSNNDNKEVIKYIINSGKRVRRMSNVYNVSPETFRKEEMASLVKDLYEKHDTGTTVSEEEEPPKPDSIKYMTSSWRWEINVENIKFQEMVHMGEYSYSYKAVYNGIMVIVKIPTKQDLNVIAREDLRARLSLTRRLRHRSISPIIAASLKEPLICLLSYWRTLGNLKTYIDSSRVCNFKKDIKLLYDVACAFNYCHSQDIPIYHMNLSDIKVLFILEDSIEVTGFGVKSFPLNSRSPVGCDYLLKRPEWVPPEYIENTQHFNVPEYDVFSYGILMCKLLSRTDPYEDMNPMRLAINIVKNSLTPFIPKGIPDSITNLILSCVNKNPKARPSFENICEVIKRTIGIPSGGNGAERGAASPVVSWSEKFESDKSYQYSE